VRPVEEMLEQAVLVNGLRVGRVIDVILEPEHEGVVGFEVRCEDGRHRFLPKAAAIQNGSAIEVDSPFALLDTDQLDFYRQRGLTLRTRRESVDLSR
jgi:hypothetical protein